LIQQIDADYGIFDGLTFKNKRWEDFLQRRKIVWPRLPSGALKLDDDTFKEMALIHPIVTPIREARRCLSQLRLKDFACGADGRHRCMLSPFGSKTGRNQPSTSKFIFGGAVWVRNLITPATGTALAYVDYAQQEFGIAAALSGDTNMMDAYQSGDPYLKFAVMAGAVPVGATKESNAGDRELFKTCALGVQYGMQANSLALRINSTPAHARELIDLHRRTFPRYWSWSDMVQDSAMLNSKLTATFGWEVHVTETANPRSLRNFPLQANGAEMLRIACILARERGVEVCAPVHDALLIEAPAHEIDTAVATCRCSMEDAATVVLDGFRLRTEARVIEPGQRFDDPRGRRMWDMISSLLTNHDEIAA
ncbi:MAG: DNA polymerase, partial [Chthoniobacterales bacterium]